MFFSLYILMQLYAFFFNWRKNMKRIFLFLATNLAVMITLSIVASLFGVNRYLTQYGLNYTALLGFALVFGFGGAFISLAISKMMAKWTMNLQIINGSEGPTERWLVDTIAQFSQNSGIGMPEVAIYNSPDMNAFATGPTKNNSLVAVSTGLLNNMTRQEAEAVLGHEVAHIANGDMVTLTLLQGVVNTFVIFISRVLAYVVDGFFRDKNSNGPSWTYSLISIVFEIMFGILASIIVATYSRRREFAADRGGASLAGKQSMINALYRLGQQNGSNLATNLQAFGISGNNNKFLALLSTHPPLQKRIEALQTS